MRLQRTTGQTSMPLWRSSTRRTGLSAESIGRNCVSAQLRRSTTRILLPRSKMLAAAAKRQVNRSQPQNLESLEYSIERLDESSGLANSAAENQDSGRRGNRIP